MGQVRWTNAAVNDLQAIREYAADSSAVYAERLVERLIARTFILTSFPQAGRMVPEFQQPAIRELIERNYRIIYLIVSDARVDVSRIHYSRRPLTEM